MKKVVHLALDAALLVGAASFLFLVAGPLLFGYRTVTMLTGSMPDAVPRGSVAIVTEEPTARLQPGQVITYEAPLPDRRVVTHRVVSVDHESAGTTFTTKGDANAAADPWTATVHADHVWVVRGVVPGLGSVIRELSLPGVRQAAAIGLPTLLCLWVVAGIWRRPAAAQAEPDLKLLIPRQRTPEEEGLPVPPDPRLEALILLRRRAAESHLQLAPVDLRTERLRERAAASQHLLAS